MNTFYWLGILCLIVATPWRMRKWLYTRTPGEIYQSYRTGTAPRYALQVLGMGLLLLGFWRHFSGE